MTNRISRRQSYRKYRKRYVRKNSSKRRNKTVKRNVINNERNKRTIKMKGGAWPWDGNKRLWKCDCNHIQKEQPPAPPGVTMRPQISSSTAAAAAEETRAAAIQNQAAAAAAAAAAAVIQSYHPDWVLT